MTKNSLSDADVGEGPDGQPGHRAHEQAAGRRAEPNPTERRAEGDPGDQQTQGHRGQDAQRRAVLLVTGAHGHSIVRLRIIHDANYMPLLTFMQ